MQKYNLQKSSKKNQNPSRFCNFVTNIKFQHKPKYHLLKIIIYKYTSYLGAEAKIPLTIILYNESKYNILALVGKAIKFDKTHVKPKYVPRQITLKFMNFQHGLFQEHHAINVC
jgi:CRISPR/Cas system-associated protein Cas10 (large subunit of type III CRISPR-Cas system)